MSRRVLINSAVAVLVNFAAAAMLFNRIPAWWMLIIGLVIGFAADDLAAPIHNWADLKYPESTDED